MDDFEASFEALFEASQARQQQETIEVSVPMSTSAPVKQEDSMPDPYLTPKDLLTIESLYKLSKRPENTDKWKPSHKALLKAGVRAGHVYVPEVGPYSISVLGYNNSGFLFTQTSGYSKDYRFHHRRDSTYRGYISGPPFSKPVGHLLDKDGFSLPGRELDVTLCALMLSERTFQFPDGTVVSLSFCRRGHHHFEYGSRVSGYPCDLDPEEAQTGPATERVLALICKAINCSGPLADRWAYCTTQVTEGRPSAGLEPYTENCHKPAYANTVREKISGLTVSITAFNTKDKFTGILSARSCGRIHLELPDGNYGDGPFHLAGIRTSGWCPDCNKPGFVLNNTKLPPNFLSAIETQPLPLSPPPSPQSGDVLLDLRKQYPIVLRTPTTGYTSHGKFVKVDPAADPHLFCDISSSLKAKDLFTEDGLIKYAPVRLDRWARAITGGTKLYFPSKDKIVTSVKPPTKINDDWFISVAEENSFLNLVKDLRTVSTPPLYEGSWLSCQGREYQITSLSTITELKTENVEEKLHLPKIGLFILYLLDYVQELDRPAYTVKSLMEQDCSS